jgi:diguanylate cyclase (GGDEF)-like protein/PAS domain S-box-containing protein
MQKLGRLWQLGTVRPAYAILTACAVLLAGGWGITLERVAEEKEQVAGQLMRENDNLVLAYEQHVARTLEQVDQAVRFLRHEHLEEGARLDLPALFAEHWLNSPLFLYAAIVDARGKVIRSTRRPTPSFSVANRDYFLHHRSDASDLLRIGAPTGSRADSRPAVHASRRISAPDGSFAGVALIALDPERMADFQRLIELGPSGVVQLVGLDGIARVRRHGASTTFGDDMADSQLVQLARENVAGRLVTRGRTDGVVRWQSYRRLEEQPFVVGVGRGAEESLAGFHRQAASLYAAAAGASVLLLLLGAGLVLFLERERRHVDRLARQQLALSELARGEVLHGTQVQQTIERLTEAAAEVLRVERVSYWRIETDLECIDLHERSGRRHAAGGRLRATDYPLYVAALRQDQAIVAADAHKDPRTAEFSTGYLTPLGIGAMLDVPVIVNGRPAGVLCHEHVGGPREWHADEQLFANAVAGMISLVLERAERRRAEEAGAVIAQRNSALVEALGEIAYDWLPLEDKLVWEGDCGRVLGYTREEIGNDTASWLDRVHPDDLQAVKDEIANLAPARPRYRAEYRFRHRDGSYRWLHDSGIGFFSREGILERITGVCLDISQRKVDERMLRMEHGITRCLAEAGGVAGGLKTALATLCEAQGWEAARCYVLDEEADVLRYAEGWTIADAKYEDFNTASRVLTFRRGLGMGGLVWQSGEPMWVPDVTRDARVANPTLASSGIRSAFVFPVVSAGATVGIVATFSREVREPDERLQLATRAIGAQIGQFVERQRAEKLAAHLAHFDALTGLPNRTLFCDRLAQALNQARRHDWNVGVLFLDVDRFKSVNDTLGHGVGDRLLQEAAKRLSVCVRAGDTVARIGGDEFAVIASDLANAQDARLVAAKMIDALSTAFTVEGHELYVSGSVGIATYPLDGQDGVALMKNADAATTRAKELGRNNYQFYTGVMNERALENLHLQNDLRRALERNEFRLHFQPKASLAQGHAVGFEALLRWERPGHGLVSPAKFIPLLEETGLIVPVGDWVIRSACAQLRDWKRDGLKPLPIAVNLAAKQLANHDIVAVVEAALRDHAVAPELLEIEITESDAMQSGERAMAMLQRLRSLGVSIAIDDFGTGYSSLSYLKRFPVDTLKLDRSFVRGLPDDADDVPITLAVITMAHSLGLDVVAEGVETPAQREFLASHKCDVMQGYLLSPPLPAEQVAKYLSPLALRAVAGGD